jgi:hypothetical protein
VLARFVAFRRRLLQRGGGEASEEGSLAVIQHIAHSVEPQNSRGF